MPITVPDHTTHPQPPLAYTRGYQDFYGREFLVTPDVLIPRPESEQIIDLVLTLAGKPYLPGVQAPTRVLPDRPIIIDIGTGSGCLAITIKKELPEAEVYATDISTRALEVATQNARRLDVSINFIISHLCQKVNSLNSTYVIPDLVVANLPYVDPDWDWLDKPALSYEPATALYADDHGLALIKELITTVTAHHLILEADPCQHDTITEYAKQHNYHLVEIRGYILHFIGA